LDECLPVFLSGGPTDLRANTFMNSWNPELVKAGYENQFKGYFQTHPNGRESLNPNLIAPII
jgi:hypothetical protein